MESNGLFNMNLHLVWFKLISVLDVFEYFARINILYKKMKIEKIVLFI